MVDLAYLRGREPAVVAEQLCAGGADILQVRAKGAPREQIQRMAQAILPVARHHGVWLVINDHPGVAAAIAAPICHLGQEDFFGAGHANVASVVPAGSDLRIGLSSHAPDQALRAVAAGAAYLGVGPVYATPTKPGRPPVGLDYVRWAAANLELPWFAIGGIDWPTLDDVLEAGARRVCLVSALLNAPDPVGACRAFKQRLN
jgi:thiamine-phosphate pyrophosphorylase